MPISDNPDKLTKKVTFMKNKTLLIVAILFIAFGIIGLTVLSSGLIPPSTLNLLPTIRFSSQGEQIFFTGTTSKRAIPFEGGPIWLRRMGGGCASCHGEDGRGGIPIMMYSEIAPDITYDELAKEEMTDEDIKKAIREGVDEKGESLSRIMPRWKMTDEELNAVINFLKKLSK